MGEPNPAMTADAMFTNLDVNHDGKIEPFEIDKSLINKVKPNPLVIFRTLDINRNSHIEVNELESEQSTNFIRGKHRKIILQTKQHIKIKIIIKH